MATERVKIQQTVPDTLAVIGRLVKIKLKNGDIWGSKKSAILATDPRGRELYIVPDVNAQDFKPLSGAKKAAEGMVRRFHGSSGSSRPTGMAMVTMPDAVPDTVNVLGEVREIVYEPHTPSPKAGTMWFHEIGDMGPGQSGSVVILATDVKGQNAFLLVTKRGKNGTPYVNNRGLVG